MAGTATLTPSIALASGQDAGNASMRAANRTTWNDEDFDAAAERTNSLLLLIPFELGGLMGIDLAA